MSPGWSTRSTLFFFSFLRPLPHLWVFIKKKKNKNNKKTQHNKPQTNTTPPRKIQTGFICMYVLVSSLCIHLCWAFLENMWFQGPLVCFRYWLTSWNKEEQAGNVQLKFSLPSVWQNYERSFSKVSDKCQENLKF